MALFQKFFWIKKYKKPVIYSFCLIIIKPIYYYEVIGFY